MPARPGPARPRPAWLDATLASAATIVLVVGAGALAWFSVGRLPAPTPVTAAPTATADCYRTVGIVGNLSSPWITPYLFGAQLRIDEYALTFPECALRLLPYDTTGSTESAAMAAKSLVVDPSVIGVIGGIYSPETAELLPTLQEAGLAMVSPGATRTSLTQDTGSRVFHRVVASDRAQGLALGRYLRQTLADYVYIVQDGSPYASDIADGLEIGLDGQVPNHREAVTANDYVAMVARIAVARPSHVFYSGSLEVAPTLVADLRAAGVDAQVITTESLLTTALPDDNPYVGAIAVCPCAPGTASFQAAFLRAFGSDPAPGAAEGYDAASVFVDVLASGADTRAQVLAGVDAYDEDGVTKRLRFDRAGDLAAPVAFAYRVTPTGIEPLMPLTVE